MTQERAFLLNSHYQPPSGSVSGLDVRIEYPPNTARLHIELDKPIAARIPTPEALAAQLRALGEVLLRIAENPSAIYTHHPPQSS
jgi:hypothetical protein